MTQRKKQATNKNGLSTIAIDTLKSICQDSQASAASKAQAARTLLEYLNLIGAKADAPKDETDLSGYSMDELNAEITRLEGNPSD